MLRYAQIREIDISDGPGSRVGLYVQGCNHKCLGCFNPETWDFNRGQEWNLIINKQIIKLMDKKYIRGLSLLGGDPICAYLNNPDDNRIFLELIQDIKDIYPNKTIWCWTGYYFEELVNFDTALHLEDTDLQKKITPLVKLFDVVVDGPYMKSLHNDKLPYMGSENQRVISVSETINSGKIVLYGN
jgi:anaerobic ribonucleoside-triphosphate reductase activating protein